MKTLITLLQIALASALHAAPRSSANYSIAAETADAGGRRTTSANYTNDGSVGLIAGLSSVAAPVETAKHGYIAQLFDVTGLVVNAPAPSVNETATLQLGARQLLDDATFLTVNAASVAWSVIAGPITGISTGGLATAGAVFQNTPATVQGIFAGNTSSLNFTVLDSIADNFGVYSGDGVGDDWQVQYFGQDNPNAAPNVDFSGNGHTNLFKYIAGLNPLDPNSRFILSITPVAGQPTRKNITLSPRLSGRIYRVMFKTDLNAASWSPLGASSTFDVGQVRTVTDLNAIGGAKFYHVEITKQ